MRSRFKLPRVFKRTPKRIELIVVRDCFSPHDVEVVACDNLTKGLKQAFGDRLPANTRLYHNCLTSEHDVTPNTPKEVDKLTKLDGRIYAVVYPADPVTMAIVTVVVSVAVSVAVALLMPMPALPNQRSSSAAPSPNNALAARTNRQRLGGRIPDIFGQVWAVPDLIAPTYSVYIDHDEVEYSYMCLGRGYYQIDKVLDDTADITKIRGACVEVYEPKKSVVFADPQKRFGNNYTDAERKLSRYYVKRYSAVNGQVLPPPDNYFVGDNNVKFTNGNKIITTANDVNFTQQFAVGDTVAVEGADNLASANNLTFDNDNDAATPAVPVVYNLNGEYAISALEAQSITLNNPVSVNADWQKLNDNNDSTPLASINLSTESQNLWTDWFYTDGDDYYNGMYNLVAPNGIYTSTGDKHAPSNVRIVCQSQVLDDNGDPITDTAHDTELVIKGRMADELAGTNPLTGAAEYKFTSSDEVRRTAAKTGWVNNPNMGVGKQMRVRFRRVTQSLNKYMLDKGAKQTNVDEVKLKDFYAIGRLERFAAPDATTVYVKQLATEGALALKERKLRLLVTRLIAGYPAYGRIATKDAGHIIQAIATDTSIGNMGADSDLDMPQIMQTVQQVRDYFGDNGCAEFCHTFDSTNLSAEESIATVANAIFCTAYRLGSKIRLHFERPVDASVALFNGYNILPDSFTKAESFGVNKDLDGVEVTYTDPKDGAKITLHHPSQGLPNMDKHELVGVRNKKQAHAHMMRRWQKHLYAYKSIQLDGMDESNTVIPTQRITVADQTRADTVQGQVVRLNGLSMTLSDPVSLGAGSHTLFLQTQSGTVENISITQGADAYTVTLARAPAEPISLEADGHVVSASYQIVTDTAADKQHYIVTAKEPSEGMVNSLTAVNYDGRFYAYDKETVSDVGSGGNDGAIISKHTLNLSQSTKFESTGEAALSVSQRDFKVIGYSYIIYGGEEELDLPSTFVPTVSYGSAATLGALEQVAITNFTEPYRSNIRIEDQNIIISESAYPSTYYSKTATDYSMTQQPPWTYDLGYIESSGAVGWMTIKYDQYYPSKEITEQKVVKLLIFLNCKFRWL